MIPSLDAPPGPHRFLPASTSTRLAELKRFALRTWPGRLLVGGVAVKLVAALVRLLVGREPLPVAAVNILAGVGIVAGAGYCLFRLFLRAKRHMLWRVRRKLILSYIFIGVVPALLIVSFFLVSGLILFLNVASYLVRSGIENVMDEAVYLARVTALEIQRGPGPQAAGAILQQRFLAFSTRYPGASIALVPTGPEPCSSAVADALTGALVPAARTQRQQAPDRRAPRTAVIERQLAGPWSHMPPPATLPAWVSCNGFGGMVVQFGEQGGGSAQGQAATVRGALRGVGLPDMADPTYAVIVDIPKNEALGDVLRAQTSIKVGEISIVNTEGSGGTLGSRSVSTGEAAAAAAATSKRRFPWISWLEYRDWTTGRSNWAAVSIEVNIADIYDRLSAAQAQIQQLNFGTVLLGILLLVAALFLVIEAAALVMGLALARSITGSVHELFAGTERVRAGDFSHRIEVKARDQLGELADSFNQMTASIEDLLRQAEEKKRLEEELRIAREIQMSLLPRGRVTVPGLSVSALCVPAREVGGDYYDLLPIDDNRLAVLIADVAGKGTSAALYMAELKGLVLSLARTCASPRQLMLSANRIISENLDSRAFITMTYAVVDLAARTMTYARAGHTPLIYRRAGGTSVRDPRPRRPRARPAHRQGGAVRAAAAGGHAAAECRRRPAVLHRRHQRGDELRERHVRRGAARAAGRRARRPADRRAPGTDPARDRRVRGGRPPARRHDDDPHEVRRLRPRGRQDGVRAWTRVIQTATTTR